MSSLRGQMEASAYGDMLEMATAAVAKVAEMKVKAAEAETKAAEAETKAAQMETKFVKEKGRADRLRREVQDSKRALLINKGHVASWLTFCPIARRKRRLSAGY